MKKIIIVLCIVITVSAHAQSERKPATDTRKDEVSLKKTVAAKKEEKHEMNKDLEHLKIKAAVKERGDVHADNKIIHRKAKHLRKYHHVKHPVVKAEKELKREKELKEKH